MELRQRTTRTSVNMKQRFTLDVDFVRSVLFRSILRYDLKSISCGKCLN